MHYAGRRAPRRLLMMCVAGIAAGVTALGLGSASFAAPQGNVSCASGAAGLVDAINAANSAGGGTINLAAGCTYSLTTPDNGENGLPVVTSQIRVNGNGATIDGTGSVRILEVDGPSGSLSLQDVTLTGGSASDFGGAIANLGGTVSLNHSLVTGNAAADAGGGIANATFDPSSVAKLTLNHSAVNDNEQTAGPDDENALGGGGIVNVLGTVTLNQSQANGNDAEGFVGGGIASGDYFNFSSTSSVLTLNNSQVDGNTAPNAGGGGIQNLLGSATLNNSEVDGNTSLNGGGISSGSGGNAPPLVSHLTLNNSEVDGNTATTAPGEGPPIAGGGIANGGEALLNNSEVDNNTASHAAAGGISNHGRLTLNNSEVNGNSAAGTGLVGSGGGIVSVQGPPETGDTILTINNSRVNGNHAHGDGGGIANGVPFGGMPLVGGELTLHNSQVTANTAAHGGGIFNSGGSVTLSNTAVTGNTPDNCEPPGTIAGCTG
jgi:hypothetical protein